MKIRCFEKMNPLTYENNDIVSNTLHVESRVYHLAEYENNDVISNENPLKIYIKIEKQLLLPH